MGPKPSRIGSAVASHRIGGKMRPSSAAIQAPRNIKNVYSNEQDRLALNETGILKNKLASMKCIEDGNASRKSFSSQIKINKDGIVNNWLNDELTKYEDKQDIAFQIHLKD